MLTPYCLCTNENYGEPRRNSSLEITLTSSAWIKEAQCKLGSGTCGIWQQHTCNSLGCQKQAWLYCWISWYISKNTGKQFAYPKAFQSIPTVHRAHESWLLCSFSLSCEVRCKWLNVKERNLSTGPPNCTAHIQLYSAFLLRSCVKQQHRLKPSPTKIVLASFQRLQTFQRTSTQTEGHTFELVTCSTKAGLIKSTLVRHWFLGTLHQKNVHYSFRYLG